MSGESVVSSAVPAAATRTTSFKGTSPSSKYVKLNVGGALYYTTMQTLTKQDTMLKAMFSGRMEVLTDSEGWILIDRCGKHFGTILNYLRDGAVPLPESRREIEELLAEAKYYLVQGLVEECQAALQQNKDAYEPFCKVPVITSSKEEQKLIATSNKESFCSYQRAQLLLFPPDEGAPCTSRKPDSNSDDNMLKNIELFDKLSLRFNGRVLFIKDVIGDEICCWSFYGQGRKIAEVCCTSIVYATEKKQTKVEFPEARIYEETLNILLYEAQDGRGPDNALLEATGGAAGRSHHLDEDEERERERIERVRRIHIK
ncbi:BTB/POZ domain-containing adapter for CUL3-mediated RhoA degradation protein 3 [Myotis brandtii]|uniref:BTB/POZ domain-containing adapter for CUL3-mediated RhoA degradation protein 3 n=1 Tax=Myotis brandtii TaxID=109478 RepID=S7MZ67_MYOBR|nr:BTB/POZ domain-containing adapter for CUL3-mediated RhoA degradation protein 3 [Myotis brandtii]